MTEKVLIVIEVSASELEFDECYSSIDRKGNETRYDDDVSMATWWNRPIVEFYGDQSWDIAVQQMHNEIRGWV